MVIWILQQYERKGEKKSIIMLLLKALFRSIISPPPAKNFDIKIIFYTHASLKKFVLPVQSLKIFIFCLTFR